MADNLTPRPTDPCMLGEPQFERVDGDFYPTPPENLDCLAHFLDFTELVVWECACGEGHLSKRLSQLAAGVVSTDLFSRGFGTAGIDFLKCQSVPAPLERVSNLGDPLSPAIITNPPYGDLAEQFIRHALELMRSRRGVVAMFLRNEYDCAKERMDLFRTHPFAMKIIVTKRPRWIAGSKGSPRHTYAWYVWDFRRINAFEAALLEQGHPTMLPNPYRPPALHYLHPNEAQPIGLIQAAAA